MKRTPLLFLFPLFLAASLSAQGTEHDLRTKAAKGASVWLTQESTMEQAIDMGGQQMDMGNSTTYTIQVTVKDVDDKGMLTVEAKIARIAGSLKMPMGMGDIDFDSIDQKADGKAEQSKTEEDEGFGGPNPDAIGKAMMSLSGSTFTAQMDAFGSVKSIKGVDEALDRARKQAGRIGAQMLGAQLNDKAMERLVQSAFGTLPDKPMAVGATWERNEDAKSSRMNTSNKLKLTLAKVDDETFEIGAVGTVEKAAGEAPAATEGKEEENEQAAMAKEMLAKMKIENGKIEGTSKISRKDGFLVESTSKMSMDISMPSPMGGDMTIKQKSVSTTKRTTAEAAMKKADTAPAKQAGK